MERSATGGTVLALVAVRCVVGSFPNVRRICLPPQSLLARLPCHSCRSARARVVIDSRHQRRKME